MRSRPRSTHYPQHFIEGLTADSHICHVLEKHLRGLAGRRPDYAFDLLSQLKGLSWRHVDFAECVPCGRIRLEVVQVLDVVWSGEYERNLLCFSFFREFLLHDKSRFLTALDA